MVKKTVKRNLKDNKLMLLAGIALVLIVTSSVTAKLKQDADLTTIKPADFSTNITNKYYALPVGKHIVYETKTDEGLERDEVWVTGDTKVISGVTTLIVNDRVWLNGVLHEDTRDYLAQYKNGDIWYFGEDVDNFDKTGKLANHAGAWLSGIDGGKPGIWVKENPKVDESYGQEYLKGEAEDMVTTTSLDEAVTVRGKTYTNCMKTHEWTPLDPASLEDKYYCPEVNMVVLEVDLGSGEKTELVEIN